MVRREGLDGDIMSLKKIHWQEEILKVSNILYIYVRLRMTSIHFHIKLRLNNISYYIYILASVDGTCNEELVFEFPTSGQIATPNFENNYYGNDTDCTWEISTRKLTENKGQPISGFLLI